MVNEPEEVKMKVEALTQKAEEDIAALIAKKSQNYKRKPEKKFLKFSLLLAKQ